MEQSDPIESAQQGNIEAIATLLSRALDSEGAIATTSLKDGRLQILLESPQIPNERVAVPLIRRELRRLNLDFIRTVRIEGRRTGKRVSAWTEEFTFEQITTLGRDVETTVPEAISDRDTQGRASDVILPSPEFTRQRPQSLEFLKSLRTFSLSAVFPYREALSPSLYRHNTVKLLLFFGLFPLTVSLIAGKAGLELSLQQAAWILGIYYACIWGVVLHNLIRPLQFSWRDTLKCILFTLFVGIPLLLFLQQVPPFSLLYAATEEEGGLIMQLVGFVLGVGVLEEFSKALPVYLLLLRPGKLSDPLTSAFYGTMSGLGFAISEGVVYSAQYAFGLAEGELDIGSYVLSNTIRLVCLPLFHALWAGIVGYFIGLAAINPSREGAIIFIGVAIAALLHGLYDTFAEGLLGLGIMAFSILLFVAYLRHSQKMIDEMRQAELRATEREF